MFVRFRERANDAREPAAGGTRSCTGRCEDRYGQRRGIFRNGVGCPEKPRCRWRIDGQVPYRLHVSLAETRRAGGRVEQAHVAALGAIEGCLLPGFFAADAVPQGETWTARSVWARFVFWAEFDERLTRLGNRLGPDEPESIRAAVEARVPRPAAEDVIAVELQRWTHTRAGYTQLADGDRQQIAKLEAQIAGAREGIEKVLAPAVDLIDAGEAAWRSAVAAGDAVARERAQQNLTRLSQLYVQLLAKRIRSW